jgi:hypothetical protein
VKTSSAVTLSGNKKFHLSSGNSFPLSGVLAREKFYEFGRSGDERMKALVLLLFLFSPLVVNTNAQTTLQPGTPLERTLGPGQIHEFSVNLEANNLIQFVVEQRGIDVIVKVFTPGGKTIGEYDTPNGAEGPEHVSFVSAAAGSYRIQVTPLDSSNAATGNFTIKILELREATDQELKTVKNLAVVKAKGIALLAEAEETIPQIKSRQARIRIQLQAAQLLWETDEKRALKHLNDAAAGIRELLESIDPDERVFLVHSTIAQLRYEVIQALAARHPQAALDLLHSTSSLIDPTGKLRDYQAQEHAVEIAIADQIVAKDPKLALEVARQLLKKTYPSNLMSTVSTLRREHPEMAAELTNELADKLLNEKLLKNPEAGYLAANLLRFASSYERRVAKGGPAPAPVLPDDKFRDLVQKILSESLSYPAPSQNYAPERDVVWNMLSALKQLGPIVDTVKTGGTAAVEKKVAEFNSSGNNDDSSQYQNTIGTNSVDVALAQIGKALEQHREQLYIQLAGREANAGDLARAKQIINDYVGNPSQRRVSLMNLEQQAVHQAMSKGKVDEALRGLSAFRNSRERAEHLAQIVNQIGTGQKREAALNFLEQARALLNPSVQAEDQEQMNALFELARAFSQYDSKRAFEIVDPLIEQFNEICAAARTLDGFGNDYYEDEELDLHNENPLTLLAVKMSSVLGSLALRNFDRAKLSSDRIRRPEVRLKVYLDIAQQAIQAAK